jgi:protein-S-isoprenylcysteine O-methyltransferase Ste14
VGLVPWLLFASQWLQFEAGPWRWLGVAPAALGVPGLLWCVFDFARVGRGTLAPLDPPKIVVRSGLYRWVRNPMYVSNLFTLLGESLLYQSWAVALWTVVAGLGFHLFVVLYEEPHLARTFGAEYEAYLASVPRWLPRPPRSTAS